MIFGAPGTEILIFGVREAKILIFGAPGIENIDFWCSGIRKYLIFGAPEAPTKGGDPSTCQNPPESFEKTLVFGGVFVARRWRAKSWTP